MQPDHLRFLTQADLTQPGILKDAIDAAEQAQANAAASAQAAQDAAIRAGTITGVSLDTDGTPYFDSTGTAILAVDTDGTPYIY